MILAIKAHLQKSACAFTKCKWLIYCWHCNVTGFRIKYPLLIGDPIPHTVSISNVYFVCAIIQCGKRVFCNVPITIHSFGPEQRFLHNLRLLSCGMLYNTGYIHDVHTKSFSPHSGWSPTCSAGWRRVSVMTWTQHCLIFHYPTTAWVPFCPLDFPTRA